jgi:imidazolonepropionase
MNQSQHKLNGPFKQLLTMTGLPLKGALSDDMLPVLEGETGILVNGAIIEKIGKYPDLLKEANSLKAEIHHLDGGYVCLPGFIDAHTHICFHGSRTRDYALRNSGKTYLEIAKAGGGIWDTVTQTRKASQQELEEGITKRASRHLSEGVTTIEVKSGYGLSVDEELKMLRAIQAVKQSHPADFISTCLAAHILPKDFNGDQAVYLDEISAKLLPVVQAENLSNRVDIFVEESAFPVADARKYLTRAKEMGFAITIHADQFSTGGSALAVELEAVSADHLEASTDKEIAMLAASDVIAVALPGASLGLGCAFAPARKLLDAGAALAIASDWNPGSAPMGDLLIQAAVLGASEKLSNAEVLAGITCRAAAALQLNDRGKLESGALADFIAFPCNHYSEILWQQGKLKPEKVWKRGVLV